MSEDPTQTHSDDVPASRRDASLPFDPDCDALGVARTGRSNHTP